MKKSNNILIVSSEFPPGPGGIGNHAYNLFKIFKSDNWNVVLFVKQLYVKISEKNEFNKNLKKPIYNIIDKTTIFSFLINFWSLNKIIKKHDIETIICSGLISTYLLGFWSFFKKNKKIITIIHAGEYLSDNYLLRKLSIYFLNKSDKIICVSNFTKNKNIFFGVDEKIIEVIHNGADVKRQYDIDCSNINSFPMLNANNKILVTIGSISNRKGQLLSIKAMQYVIKEFKNCHYLIIGLNDNLNRYQKIVSKLNLTKNIHFLGVLDFKDIKMILSYSHIYLLTSRFINNSTFEGFGISVIEAASQSLPAIVTKTSGVSESIIDKETGFLASELPTEIASKILYLLKNENKRIKIGKNARIRAMSSFSWRKVGTKYKKIIYKINN